MLKRMITLLLAVSMLVSMTACGGSEQGADTTTAGTVDTTTIETEPEEPLELPEGLDYKGYSFKVLSRPDTRAEEILAEEETGEILTDSVYRRNRLVEELLNIDFEVLLSSSDYETDALNTILAGDDSYDVVFPAARAAFTYAQNEVCLNWHDVPNIDLTKSWWIQDIVENFSINGKLYCMTGDLSQASLGASVGMVFNKSIFDDYNIEYPYELVESGAWTFDTFAKLAEGFGRDLNGDNEMKIEDDQFGYGSNHWCGPINALYATGERIITLNSDGLPELTLYNEKVVDVYQKYMKLILSEAGWNQLGGSTHQTAFCEGRFAFVDVNIWHLSNDVFRETEVEFGLVPWPKYDETVDKYYSFVDAGSSLAIIPVTASDPARTGAVLEAMAYYGQKEIIPAYYNITLQNKYLRDDMSITMLDYVNEGRTFDLGYYNNSQFGGKLANPGYNLVHDTTLSFTTLYSANEQSVLALIEKSTAMYLDEE